MGSPLDQNALRTAIGSNGSAANPGDKVQITKLTFHAPSKSSSISMAAPAKVRVGKITVQLEVGGVIPTVGTPRAEHNHGCVGAEFAPRGATPTWISTGPLPDMTPDELKADLAAMLDFSQQRYRGRSSGRTQRRGDEEGDCGEARDCGDEPRRSDRCCGQTGQKNSRETQPDGTERED